MRSEVEVSCITAFHMVVDDNSTNFLLFNKMSCVMEKIMEISFSFFYQDKEILNKVIQIRKKTGENPEGPSF